MSIAHSDAIEPFIEHASAVRTVPDETASATSRLLMDTLAVGLAGSSAAGIDAGLALTREAGGAPQATILVHGDRVPAGAAALINATQCAARDFDPIYEPGVMLPYAPITGAAFAAAELAGAPSSAVVTAVALGTDLACRIGASLETGLAWSRTATLGTFGAAMASGWLLGLRGGLLRDALGLALSQSSGTIQSVVEGTLAKRYQAGFAAQAGLLSALLASRGVTGPEAVLEGRYGFLALYENGRYQRPRLLDGLGERFEGAHCSIKPYPCAREQHAAVTAAIRLRSAGIEPSEIAEVRVALTPNAFSLSGGDLPEDADLSIGRAMASAAYGVAVALTNGGVGITDFDEEAIRDVEVRSLAARTAVVVDESVSDSTTLVPQTVTVVLRDGTSASEEVRAIPGGESDPMDVSRLKAKARACGQAAARDLSAEAVDAFLDGVLSMASPGGPSPGELLASISGTPDTDSQP